MNRIRLLGGAAVLGAITLLGGCVAYPGAYSDGYYGDVGPTVVPAPSVYIEGGSGYYGRPYYGGPGYYGHPNYYGGARPGYYGRGPGYGPGPRPGYPGRPGFAGGGGRPPIAGGVPRAPREAPLAGSIMQQNSRAQTDNRAAGP